MNKGTVITNITNKVATITFFHPAGNSLPSELIDRLIESIERLADNDDARVIVLQSEGDKSFCGGASFNELMSISNLEQGKQFFSGFANIINSMRKCPKFIIGRAQGKAVGGGVGILAATDYCFATEAADIKLSELSIGIGPFVIAPAVERKIGVSALSELTLDATHWRTAYWAKNKGLFNTVFDNSRDMDASIAILASNLTKYSLEAMQEMKKVLWENTAHWDALLLERAEISGKLVLSDFTKNALMKFKMGRSPLERGTNQKLNINPLILLLQVDIEEKIKNAPDSSYEIGVVIGTYLPFVVLIGIAYLFYYRAKKKKNLGG